MGCVISSGEQDIFNQKFTSQQGFLTKPTDQDFELLTNINSMSIGNGFDDKKTQYREFKTIGLNDFILGEIVGLGGFGLVRAVQQKFETEIDCVTQSCFAMKSLAKHSVLKRPTGPQAVLIELQALQLLRGSPFVCNLHYAFQDSTFLFMVMDLATGGDLRFNLRMSKYGRISENVARFYFCQIALALDSCHRVSVLHRDIKPENILLTDQGLIKLTDFGVAKILVNIEDCRSTSGTHGYMAPEIYAPGHRHGIASEWFSLGILLHELLTGRRPCDPAYLQERGSKLTPLPNLPLSPSNPNSNHPHATSSPSPTNPHQHFVLPPPSRIPLDFLQRFIRPPSYSEFGTAGIGIGGGVNRGSHTHGRGEEGFLTEECIDFVQNLLTVEPYHRSGSPQLNHTLDQLHPPASIQHSTQKSNFPSTLSFFTSPRHETTNSHSKRSIHSSVPPSPPLPPQLTAILSSLSPALQQFAMHPWIRNTLIQALSHQPTSSNLDFLLPSSNSSTFQSTPHSQHEVIHPLLSLLLHQYSRSNSGGSAGNTGQSPHGWGWGSGECAYKPDLSRPRNDLHGREAGSTIQKHLSSPSVSPAEGKVFETFEFHPGRDIPANTHATTPIKSNPPLHSSGIGPSSIKSSGPVPAPDLRPHTKADQEPRTTISSSSSISGSSSSTVIISSSSSSSSSVISASSSIGEPSTASSSSGMTSKDSTQLAEQSRRRSVRREAVQIRAPLSFTSRSPLPPNQIDPPQGDPPSIQNQGSNSMDLTSGKKPRIVQSSAITNPVSASYKPNPSYSPKRMPSNSPRSPNGSRKNSNKPRTPKKLPTSRRSSNSTSSNSSPSPNPSTHSLLSPPPRIKLDIDLKDDIGTHSTLIPFSNPQPQFSIVLNKERKEEDDREDESVLRNFSQNPISIRTSHRFHESQQLTFSRPKRVDVSPHQIRVEIREDKEIGPSSCSSYMFPDDHYQPRGRIEKQSEKENIDPRLEAERLYRLQDEEEARMGHVSNWGNHLLSSTSSIHLGQSSEKISNTNLRSS